MFETKTLGNRVRPILTGLFLLTFLASFFLINVEFTFAAEWDKPGYTMTFQDEFNGNSVDLTKWNDWDINFGNRGAGIIGASNGYAYCPENVSVSGGHLRITCTRAPITAPLCGGGTKTVNYRVGEVNTQNKFQQTYGWFEARMKFPKARALYPAFWLMPGRGVTMIDQNGPGTGSGAEVDIMEYQTYWMGKEVTSSIWYGGYGANLQGGGIGTTYSPISSADGWHVYALNWEPGKLEIYVDGVKTQTYTGRGVPSGDEIVILSMAEGSWGKSVLDSELPDTWLVDYVRVYKKGTSTPTPTPTPKPIVHSIKNPFQMLYLYNDSATVFKNLASLQGGNNSQTNQDLSGILKNQNNYCTINFTGMQFKTNVLKDFSSPLLDCFKVYKKEGPTLTLSPILIPIPKPVPASTPTPTAPSTENTSSVSYNDDNAIIKYTGSWGAGSNKTAYMGDYRSSNLKGDFYTINFTGTQLKAYGQKDDWCGMADIYVDDVYQKTIDCYSSAISPNQLLYDTGVLPAGNHTVKLVVLHQKNEAAHEYYINVDKFEIIP